MGMSTPDDPPTADPLARFRGARLYPALVSREGDRWLASFPDLPRLEARAQTVAQLAANAEEALALHLEAMTRDGEAWPEPSRPPRDAGDILVLAIPAPALPAMVRH